MTWTARHFQPGEFPEDPRRYAEPALIARLDEWREVVGAPMRPSPAPGALARFDGREGTRHYAVGRLSDAVDVFVDGSQAAAWMAAVRLFGGVGFYVDTTYGGERRPMFHVDLRPEPLCWLRSGGSRYTYATTTLGRAALLRSLADYG